MPVGLVKGYSFPFLDIDISGIVCDSRQVVAGNVFVAIAGLHLDGHAFIKQAVEKGASVVVGERPLSALSDPAVNYVQVDHAREALSWLAAAWYGNPGRKMCVVGVTGTDGKTTTVRLISEILRAAGRRVGSVSTVSASIDGDECDTGLHTTTPDAMEMHRLLAEMVKKGCQYAVVESTSHGLAQHRVTSCEYDVAVVTNITHEHTDYHGTFEEYRAAKGRLFKLVAESQVKPGVRKACILNADDPSYAYLAAVCRAHRCSYGIEQPSSFRALGIESTAHGSCFDVATPGGKLHVETPLLGLFNVYNVLAAVAACTAQDVDPSAIQRGVAAVQGVPGRMESISMGQDFTVIIDFAHTPNSLEKALQTLRMLRPGKLTVVFGCAGLRDRPKRPVMGYTACRLADRVVLTAEDPRTEDVDEIIEEIAAGCRRAGGSEGVEFVRVPDRSAAIAEAIQHARPGDLVVITGKGHERSMCFGTTEYPWSDHEEVRRALAARLAESA